MDSYVLIKTCNFYVQIFQNQIELQEHQNLVHRKNNKERSSICKDCDKTFTQKGYLERHIKLAHSKNLGEGTCDQCEKTFENRFRLTIHKYDKHREKTISCEYCPIKFLKMSEKERHIKRKHLKLKNFACDKCAYKGFSHQLLRIHRIQKHSDFRPYKCQLCPMAFPRATSLYQHRETHENNLKRTKDFSCPICGKAFVSQKESERCKKKTPNRQSEVLLGSL